MCTTMAGNGIGMDKWMTHVEDVKLFMEYKVRLQLLMFEF